MKMRVWITGGYVLEERWAVAFCIQTTLTRGGFGLNLNHLHKIQRNRQRVPSSLLSFSMQSNCGKTLHC